MELISRRTPSAVFHGQLVLSNIAFGDPAMSQRCLALWRDRILPELLADGTEFDGSMSFCVASIDVEGLWPTFEGVLQAFFRHFEALGSSMPAQPSAIISTRCAIVATPCWAATSSP